MFCTKLQKLGEKRPQCFSDPLNMQATSCVSLNMHKTSCDPLSMCTTSCGPLNMYTTSCNPLNMQTTSCGPLNMHAASHRSAFKPQLFYSVPQYEPPKSRPFVGACHTSTHGSFPNSLHWQQRRGNYVLSSQKERKCFKNTARFTANVCYGFSVCLGSAAS